MEDIFDQDANENVLMEKEHSRIKDKFLTVKISNSFIQLFSARNERRDSRKEICTRRKCS